MQYIYIIDIICIQKKVTIWQIKFHPDYVAFSDYTILLTNDFMLLTILILCRHNNILS